MSLEFAAWMRVVPNESRRTKTAGIVRLSIFFVLGDLLPWKRLLFQSDCRQHEQWKVTVLLLKRQWYRHIP